MLKSTFKNERALPPLFSWSPLKRDGSGYSTHAVEYEGIYLKLKPKLLTQFLGFGISMLGLVLLMLSVPLVYHDNAINHVGIVISLIAIIAGKAMEDGEDKFSASTKQGKYKFSTYADAHDLNDIAFLQLIEKEVCRTKKQYTCYELNLVFVDGSRENILNHADLADMKCSANNIAQYLNIEIKTK